MTHTSHEAPNHILLSFSNPNILTSHVFTSILIYIYKSKKRFDKVTSYQYKSVAFLGLWTNERLKIAMKTKDPPIAGHKMGISYSYPVVMSLYNLHSQWICPAGS